MYYIKKKTPNNIYLAYSALESLIYTHKVTLVTISKYHALNKELTYSIHFQRNKKLTELFNSLIWTYYYC